VRKLFVTTILFTGGCTLLLGSLAGCSFTGVEPWQRQDLAKREMLINSEPLEAATDDHIYFSKEASSGGQSFGGGGCGCN
jgi:hypothetical protein